MNQIKRMASKLKNDKGMVYTMEAVEAAVEAALTGRIASKAQWRESKERQEIKSRIACLAAIAGNVPTTKKALAEYRLALLDAAVVRHDLDLVLYERLDKAGLL